MLKSVSRGYSKLCIAAVALGGLLWFTSSQHDQHFETGGAHVATILTTSGLIGLVSFWLVAAFFFFMRAMFRSIDAERGRFLRRNRSQSSFERRTGGTRHGRK